MKSLNVGITGASGLIGSLLTPVLADRGHRVTALVRRRPHQGELQWAGPGFELPAVDLLGFHAIIHLAGENIGVRWTESRKREIFASRVEGTRAIAHAMAEAASQGGPRILIVASAIGYYGDRGDEILREESKAGDGFLADVCRQWEAATDAARRKGIRVVHLRTGIVLSRHGGALSKMLLPFKLGLGGRIGHGNQYWSWISLDDLSAAILHAIEFSTLDGPVNAVSPSPVTNLEFTAALGKVLSRPTIFPMPAFAARLALGEMADALLLASARVEPAKLMSSRFAFRHGQLAETLRAVLSA